MFSIIAILFQGSMGYGSGEQGGRTRGQANRGLAVVHDLALSVRVSYASNPYDELV